MLELVAFDCNTLTEIQVILGVIIHIIHHCQVAAHLSCVTRALVGTICFN